MIQSLLFRPFGAKTGSTILFSWYWSAVPLKRILFDLILSHVGIRGNEEVDAATKTGLLKRDTNVPIPFSDFKKHINVIMKCKWQSEWNEDSVLVRIQIDHTHFSHSFLLEKDDSPQCIACNCSLTIKHFI